MQQRLPESRKLGGNDLCWRKSLRESALIFAETRSAYFPFLMLSLREKVKSFKSEKAAKAGILSHFPYGQDHRNARTCSLISVNFTADWISHISANIIVVRKL